jgi:hypothetical protein
MRASAGIAARRPRQAAGSLLTGAAVAMMSIAALALVYVIYLLWPRWPDAPVAVDAPAVPIVVADVLFRIPPGAIRQKVQRRPGTYDRVGLVYEWPTLTPAATLPKTTGEKTAATTTERLFVDIAATTTAMVPEERLKQIYPRYVEAAPQPGPAGLTMQTFRNDTPYRGEDVLYDASAPDRFLVRCTRDVKLVRGSCLYERFFGEADMTARFPRAWLEDWQGVRGAIDKLTEQLQPAARN